MWMLAYIREIKRQFRDVYGFKPDRVEDGEPLFDNIPDGEYPMEIDGKTDHVQIRNGRINCCRFEEVSGSKLIATKQLGQFLDNEPKPDLTVDTERDQ